MRYPNPKAQKAIQKRTGRKKKMSGAEIQERLDGKAAAEALSDHLLRFSLAGLSAVAAALSDR